MWNFIYYFILHVYVHVQYLYYREKPYHINFSKALLALNLHIILREVTDKILHTVILFFFYIKLISKSIATCGTSKPFNDNGLQLYEIRTHTVGLICILWTKSNWALYICACSASLVSIFKSYYFSFTIFTCGSLWHLKGFDLHLENLSSNLDNQLQLVLPPVFQNWTVF